MTEEQKAMEQILMFYPLIALVSQMLGKSIPDSKGGFLGFLRVVLKVIGLYVPNRQ